MSVPKSYPNFELKTAPFGASLVNLGPNLLKNTWKMLAFFADLG